MRGWEKRDWIAAAVNLAIVILGGITVILITEKEPDIRLGVYDPCTEFSSVNVEQYLITWNEGEGSGKNIELVLNNVSKRFADGIITEALPSLDCSRTNDTEDNVSLKCANLKPGARITFQLNYRVPPLRYDEVNIFADDTFPKKHSLGSPFCKSDFLP